MENTLSVMSTFGLSKKTAFQNCIPFIVTCSLGLELIGIVSLIILYDKSERSENLLYISTVSYLILSTIYFAWHSIIKENGFELLSFGLMSTILNSIAIYLAVQHNVEIAIKIVFITFFIVCQVMYYCLSLYMYRHFHRYMLAGNNESVFERKLVAVRTFETFLSMMKLDFMLYIILMATYMFYVIKKWNDFYEVGVILGVFGFLLLICHSVLGIYAVFNERPKVVGLYYSLMVLGLTIKLFFVVILTLEPGDGIENVLVEQSYVVFIGDAIVYIGILYLGCWTHRSFGIGAMSVIRKANDDIVKAPFI